MNGRRTALVIVTALTALAVPCLTRADDLAAAVKATYLYKLAPFVEWPSTAFANAEAPLTICVQGPDTFAALVTRAVAGQQVGGRPIAVRRIVKLEATSECHVAYLAGSPAQTAAQALAVAQRSPVLTVTDGGSDHGIVHFVIDGGRIRFAIDDRKAQTAGLGISSKLMALAAPGVR